MSSMFENYEHVGSVMMIQIGSVIYEAIIEAKEILKKKKECLFFLSKIPNGKEIA